MLDNSGPYGPKDVTGNIGTTTNMTQMISSSVSHNFNVIGKLSQEASQKNIPQYNALDTVSYNQQNLSINDEEDAYLHSSPSHINRTSYPIQGNSIHVRNDLNELFSYTPNAETDFNYGNAFKDNSNEVQNHRGVENSICDDTTYKTPQIDDYSIKNSVGGSSNSSHRSNNYYSQNYMIQSSNDNSKDLYSTYNDELSKINSTKELSLRAKQIQKTIQHIDDIIASDNATRSKKQGNISSPALKKESDDSAFDDNSSQEPLKPAEVYLQSVELDGHEPSIKIKDEISSMIRIEVENITDWNTSDNPNPFVQDSAGVAKDDLDLNKYELVEGDSSIIKAAEVIVTASKNNYSYECPHCRTYFKHPKRFLIHTKWHTFGQINKKRQEAVDAKLAKRAVVRGEALDQESGAYPCNDCDKIFTRANALKGHRTKAHKNLSRECIICKVVVGDWQAYREHQAAVHTSEDGFKCTRCDKVFKYKHTLAKHEHSHEEKTIACPECPKLFGSEQLLRDHSRSHERVQRGHTLHCSYCGKGYFSQFNLQVHERTHRNEKPYQCDICQAKFSTNSSLTRHIRVSHNTSKPHECPICHRCFATEASLLRHHSRFHLLNNEYVCEECPERFRRIRDMRRHTAKMHPKAQKRKDVSDSE